MTVSSELHGSMPGATAVPGPHGRQSSEASRQRAYHQDLFGRLQDWDRAAAAIRDFSGNLNVQGVLGLDQMGHFGPSGCDLVAQRLARISPDGLICELGSGFGGVARYLAAKLQDLDVKTAGMFGIEIVHEHCSLADRIGRSMNDLRVVSICADVHRLPLGDACVDAIVIAGSAPHFRHMDQVLREAHRVLRPLGALILMEEVSLKAAEASVSPAFLARHPPGVFHMSTWQGRQASLSHAGFSIVEGLNLTSWAIDLLEQRQRALRLFAGTAVGILGATEVDLIGETLLVARQEILRGAIVPMLIEARRA
jgi:SAM-dependent methyltransferase